MDFRNKNVNKTSKIHLQHIYVYLFSRCFYPEQLTNKSAFNILSYKLTSLVYKATFTSGNRTEVRGFFLISGEFGSSQVHEEQGCFRLFLEGNDGFCRMGGGWKLNPPEKSRMGEHFLRAIWCHVVGEQSGIVHSLNVDGERGRIPVGVSLTVIMIAILYNHCIMI